MNLKNQSSEAAAAKKSVLIEKIRSEKFFYYFIISIMIIMPVGELITELMGKTYVSQPHILSIYGFIGIVTVCLSLLYKYKENTYYPSDIFYGLLVFFAAMSLAFSQDIFNSVTGFYYDELPMHFMAYFSLMYAGTMINDNRLRKNILYVFCMVAALQCIVAFFQTMGFQIVDCLYDPEWHTEEKLSYGLTHHNNWYAGLSCIFVAVSTGLFIFTDRNKKIRYVYLALAMLSLYTSLSTGARIALVGNTVTILFYIASLIIMKFNGYDKKLLKTRTVDFLIAMAAWAVIIAVMALCTNFFKRSISEFASESQSGLDQMGTMRGYIWRYGLESVPKHWLTGVGLDNYIYAFHENPSWSEGMFSQAKGHNEYIHTLVTQGVFAAINYIAMLVYAIVTGVKSVIKNDDESCRCVTWIYLGMFAAYASQAFFNSSVINTAMYFWIVVGLTMPKVLQKPIKSHNSAKK